MSGVSGRNHPGKVSLDGCVGFEVELLHWIISRLTTWAGGGGKGKQGGFGGSKISHKTGREPALLPAPRLRRRLSSHEGFPTPKISLIREKTALLFWDIPGSMPVWLSGAFSQRKITANSTYWEANLPLVWARGSGMGGNAGLV